MKVCIISAGVPSEVGGLEGVVDELSRFMTRAGNVVTAIGRANRYYISESCARTIIG